MEILELEYLIPILSFPCILTCILFWLSYRYQRIHKKPYDLKLTNEIYSIDVTKVRVLISFFLLIIPVYNLVLYVLAFIIEILYLIFCPIFDKISAYLKNKLTST
jgi:hypothetical protein